MKNKVRNIVVHSTQTLTHELINDLPFHYIIHRSGRIVKAKQYEPDDVLVQIAYEGGINDERKIIDNRTPEQNEILFNSLFLLSEKFPKAKIVGADEVFGSLCYPGFNVKEWLKTYVPKSLNPAA
jgi:hypothetical protein